MAKRARTADQMLEVVVYWGESLSLLAAEIMSVSSQELRVKLFASELTEILRGLEGIINPKLNPVINSIAFELSPRDSVEISFPNVMKLYRGIVLLFAVQGKLVLELRPSNLSLGKLNDEPLRDAQTAMRWIRESMDMWGSEIPEPPPSMADKGRLPPVGLAEKLRCDLVTINRYARKAGVSTPKRGQRNCKYTDREINRILTCIKLQGSNDLSRLATSLLDEGRSTSGPQKDEKID